MIPAVIGWSGHTPEGLVLMNHGGWCNVSTRHRNTSTIVSMPEDQIIASHLAAIAGDTILVPCHVVKSQQIIWRSGPWFNIKMPSYQYGKSHCGDKTVVRSSYLHNGISYTGKTTSLYWIGTLILNWVPDTWLKIGQQDSSSSNDHQCDLPYCLTCLPPVILYQGSPWPWYFRIYSVFQCSNPICDLKVYPDISHCCDSCKMMIWLYCVR